VITKKAEVIRTYCLLMIISIPHPSPNEGQGSIGLLAVLVVCVFAIIL